MNAYLLNSAGLLALSVWTADYTDVPEQERAWRHGQLKQVLPQLWNLPLYWAGAVGCVSVVTGVAVRDFTFFYGDANGAAAMLSALAQVVGTIGVLAISVGFVLTQIAAAEVSVRAAAHLARQPTFLLAGAVFLT